MASSSPSSSVFSFSSSSSSSTAASPASYIDSDATSLTTPLSTAHFRADSASSSLPTPSPTSVNDSLFTTPSPIVSHKRKLSDASQVRGGVAESSAQREDEGEDDSLDQQDDVDDDEDELEDDAEEYGSNEAEELEEVEEPVSAKQTSDPVQPLTAAHPTFSRVSSSPTAAFAQLSTASSPSWSSSSSTPPADDLSSSTTATSQLPSFSSSSTSAATTPTAPTSRPSTRKSRPNDWYCFQGCGKHYKKSSGRSIRRHALSCYRTHHPDECRGMNDMEVHALLAVKQEDGEVQTGLRAWRLRQSRRQASELPQHERWECPNGCKQYYRSTSSKSIEKHLQTCTYKPEANKPPLHQPAPQQQRDVQQVSGVPAGLARPLLSPAPLVKHDSGGSSNTTPSPLGRPLFAGLSGLTSPFPLAHSTLTPQQLAMLQQHAQHEAVLAAMQQQQLQQSLFSQPLSSSNLQSLQQPQVALTSQQLLQLQQALYMQQQQQLLAGSNPPAPLSQLFLSSSNPLTASLSQQPSLPMMSDGLVLSAAASFQQSQQPGGYAFPSSFSAAPSSSSSSFLTPSPTTVPLQQFQQLSGTTGFLPGLSQPSPFSVNLPLLSGAAMPQSTSLSFPLSSLPPLSSHSLLQPITSVSTSAHSLSASSTLPSAAQPSQSSMLGALAPLLQSNIPTTAGLRAASFASATLSPPSSLQYSPLQASSLNLTASFPSAAIGSASFGASPLSALQPNPFLSASAQPSAVSFPPPSVLPPPAPPPTLNSAIQSSFLPLLRSPSSASPVTAPLALSLPIAPISVFSPSHTGSPGRPPSQPR